MRWTRVVATSAVVLSAATAVVTISCSKQQGTEDATRCLGFSDAFRHAAVAAHFAACEIAQADSLAGSGMASDGSAETNLEIVWVRAKRQQVELIGL